jgi:malate dehydrogenase (oxaloacetate-decarboxylating)(NADP+)
LTGKKGTYFLSDTLINRHPTSNVLYDVTKLTLEVVRFFAQEPVVAMLSYSNFGADKQGSPTSVHDVVAKMHKEYPDLAIDGEMQVNFALDKTLRDQKYPFTRLKGQDVNTLIFPNLTSANIAQKLLQEMGIGEMVGPIQVGLKKPIHFTDIESSVRDIVNITRIAVVDAIVQEKLHPR